MGRGKGKARRRREKELEDDRKPSLPVDLEEEEEKEVTCLYACFRGLEGGEIQWFRIDTTENKPFPAPIDDQGRHWLKMDSDELKPVCIWKPGSHLPDLFGACSWKSKIFVFGGGTRSLQPRKGGFSADDYASRAIFVADTKSDSMKWESVQDGLLGKRCYPGVVLVKDKFYIFGSSLILVPNYTPEPWAEMYDPETATSIPLPDPPARIKDTGSIHIFAVIDNGCKIVFLGENTKPFSYNTATRKWGRVVTPLRDLSRWNLRTTVQNQILYAFSYDQLLAYDLRRTQWFTKPVQGLDILSRKCRPATRPESGCVFSLGKNDEMCLLWSYYIGDPIRTTLSWVRFSISSSVDQESGDTLLTARIKSYATYSIPTSYFVDCLALY